ncbi:MAG: phosphate acyltransferase PlsX, partial [Erysipelotrichaceae bacterium]|nr:phosphate acyltransferase PlsX [Erysipelotrichaceae bacterium]
MKVIVDVMGGDNAPKDILKGVFIAARKIDDDFILVGNKEMIMHYIEKENIDLDRFDIVPSYSVIAMDDDPITSIYHKKDSSMVIALHLLKQGEGDVVVGAGNTGAFFSAASLIVKRREGIKRAAIGTLLPGLSPCLLLDAGANISVTDQYMEQFARIGSEYMREMFNIKYPTVGLLNNGTEEGKGTALQIETAKRLRKNEEIRFVGNVEASSVLKGVCDVVVCDGFTGNIFLKATEG